MSSLDLEAFARFIGLLRLGHERRDAARLAGMNWQTIKGWIRDHRAGVSEYASARLEEMQSAECVIVDEQLGNVRESAKGGNAKASMWLLEALRPDRFGKKKDVAPATPGTIINAMPTLTTDAAREKVFQLAVRLCLESEEHREKMLQALMPPELPEHVG